MSRFHRLPGALLLGGALLFAADSSAQQPQPGAAQPATQPGAAQPATQPGTPPGGPGGRPPQVIQLQPGQMPPGMGQPGGQPGGRPGQPPTRRPMLPGQGGPGGPGGRLPAGHPTLPGADPHGGHADAGSHGGGDHGGHCPGHGPEDPPGHINWYQGLLGVNNEKAQSASFADRLLWRYHNPKDECDTKNQEPPLLGAVINFALVLFIVFKFGKGPVMEALSKRKKTIMQDIDSANELRDDAEDRLTTFEKQLSRIEERRKEVHEEYRVQWEQEKKRILAEAEEKASRLRKDAQFRISQELKQAQADLLREAVEQAVAAAEDLLKKRIQSTDLSRLADDYASSLGEAIKANDANRKQA